jgi:hypothetical protein
LWRSISLASTIGSPRTLPASCAFHPLENDKHLARRRVTVFRSLDQFTVVGQPVVLLVGRFIEVSQRGATVAIRFRTP